MSTRAISSQHLVHEPTLCTRRSRPIRLTQAPSIIRIQPETWRTTSDATVRARTQIRGGRRPVVLLPQVDPRADDRGHANGVGAFDGETTWWARARDVPRPVDREPSGRRLRIRFWPPEQLSRGLCAIRVRAWPYSANQDWAGLNGLQECHLRPSE